MSKTEYALRIIDKLMSDPLGSSFHQDRIDLLFVIIKSEVYPPIHATGINKLTKEQLGSSLAKSAPNHKNGD